MLSVIFILALLMVALWIGLKITGALLMALLWLVVALPVSAVVILLGLACCCTILLIPLGIWLMGAGLRILFLTF